MLKQADTYIEMLVDTGFGYDRILSLLDNPGFYNLLYSPSFTHLLHRFPLENLSHYARKFLVKMTTNSSILEELTDGDLVSFTVDLLEKKLEHINSPEEHNKPISTRQLSPSYRRRPHEPMSLRPGSSPSHGPTTVHPVTIHPMSTPAHSVSFPDGSSAIPLERSRQSILTAQSAIGAQSGVPSPTPHKSSTPRSHTSLAHNPPFFQRVPSPNSLPVWSTSPRVNSSGICPSSAFNSQHASRDIIDHVVSPSGSLPSNEDSPICFTIGHSNNPIRRSQPMLSKHNYKANSGAIQRSPQPGSQQNALDSRGYFFGGIDQHESHQRGIDHDGPSCPKRALPFTPDPTSIPFPSTQLDKENSAIPWNSAIGSQYPPRSTVNQSEDPFDPIESSPSHPRSTTVAQSALNTLTGDMSVVPQGSYMLQPAPSNALPVLSVLPRVNSHFIHPGSALNSDTPRCPISHVPLSSKVLSPNETSSTRSTIGHTNPILRSHPMLRPALIPNGKAIPKPHVDPVPDVEPTLQSSDASSRWSVSNHSVRSWHTETTHVGENSPRASETSTLVHQSSSDWWDRNWSSDSLFSSDSEEVCIDDTSQYCDSNSGTPYEGTLHFEYEPGEPEEPDINGPQSGYPHDLSYDSDNDGQQFDDLEIHLDSSFDPGANLEEVDPEYELDDSPDPEYDEQDDHHLVSPNEVGCDQDPEFEDDNRVNDNGEVRDHFGDKELLFDDSNSNGFEFDDQASQRSDEPELSPDNSTHLELEEPEDEDLFDEPGDENEEYNDGASQHSDDWGILPDEQSDQGYESPCENEESYQNEVDQYRSGDHEELDEYLVLMSPNFPRSLWSLQLPKPLHQNKSMEHGCLSKPLMHQSIDVTLLELISSHITLSVAFAIFETFVRSTIMQFIQSRQLSRQFVSSIEGINVISDYREHLLLPIEYSESDSGLEEEIEVTHDAMDELFGVGYDFHNPLYDTETEDSSTYQDLGDHPIEMTNLWEEWNSTDDSKGGRNEFQHNANPRGYFALVPQLLPPSLLSLQTPKLGSLSASWDITNPKSTLVVPTQLALRVTRTTHPLLDGSGVPGNFHQPGEQGEMMEEIDPYACFDPLTPDSINNRERIPVTNEDQHGNQNTDYHLVNVPFEIPLPTQVTVWRQQIITRRTLLFNQSPLPLTPSRFTLPLTHNGCPIASDSPYPDYRSSVLDAMLIHEYPDNPHFLTSFTLRRPTMIRAIAVRIRVGSGIPFERKFRRDSRHQIGHTFVLNRSPFVASVVRNHLNDLGESPMVQPLQALVINREVEFWSNDIPRSSFHNSVMSYDSLGPIEMFGQRVGSPRPTLQALYSRRDGSREQKGTRGRHSVSVRLLTPINARYAGCSPSILIQQLLRRKNRRLKGGVKTLPMSLFAANFLLVTTLLPLLLCSDFDFWNHSKAQQKFLGKKGPMLDQTYAPYLSRPRFVLVSLLLILSVFDFHGQISTSIAFKKDSPQPGYDCSPHSSPHSQPSSLSFRDLRPHNGLHSNILHPASTGVSKNDLPCSLRVFQPLCDCSLPPLSHSHVKPPPHLSLTRLGAAKALGKLVFGAELVNLARPNGAVTQSNQHRKDNEKHISIHVILKSGVLDHLDRRHSVPREAAMIAPISAQALCDSSIAHIICVQQKRNYRMGALYPLLHTLDPKGLESPSLQQPQSPLILSSLTSRSLVPRSQLTNARSVGSTLRWYSYHRNLSDEHQLLSTREYGINSPRVLQLVPTASYNRHPPNYPRPSQPSSSGSSLSPDPSFIYAVVSMQLMHTPIDLGLLHRG
ncbi:hypothetical protein PQX77_002247 [Marasmius sp. AFHP31]|nr:hypothetical protein PQX77_002247 [Marasmius sp. AFHP31]